MEGKSVQQTLKERKRKQGKKEHFLRMRMWVAYLLSLFEKDRGKIPDNIGNRILITNNLIVTKKGMTSLVQVETLSLETPQCLALRLIETLRDKGSHAIVDVAIKNEPYTVQLGDTGLKSRIAAWENIIERDDIKDSEKEMAARCLYTIDVLRSGERLLKSRIYLKIRAKSGAELTAAEKIVYQFLADIGADYLPIAGDLKQHLQYITIASGKKPKNVKDIKSVVMSARTLSQLLPNSGSMNDTRGLLLACNIDNYSPYIIDFESISHGRNLYILAPSGGGKTVIALNLCCSAAEDGWAVCIQDIKGNEFTNFVLGTGGYIVSLRLATPGFINSFVMNAEETTDENAEAYFKDRFAFSKRQLTILSAFDAPADLAELEEFLDEFLSSVYVSLGVLADNRATWVRTESLTPFKVYEMFNTYMTPTVEQRHANIARRLRLEYRMYLSKSGSKSYVFTEEFNYLDILNANTLSFDFGLLDKAGESVDRVLFRLKFEYMRKLNAEYVAFNYKKGRKVLKILEESQIVVDDPEVLRGYVEEYTLRRSQGQTTVMLGNSVSALIENPTARPLVENVSGLLLGPLNAKAKEIVARNFGVDEYIDLVDVIGTTEKYSNCFLFINRMESDAMMPMLKVPLEEGRKYKLLTPVKR